MKKSLSELEIINGARDVIEGVACLGIGIGGEPFVHGICLVTMWDM